MMGDIEGAAKKLNYVQNWKILLLFLITGFIFFSSGLNGKFQGDDRRQIVTNEPVHSITNLPVFFQGGTFYTGVIPNTLEGGFYRPMMSTTFSILYTLFGPEPLYFHLLQLLLHIACAYLVYLLFSKLFTKSLALLLGSIFLLHPINSQNVYAIPSMQDPLFMIFGLGALVTLISYKSSRSLFIAVGLLFLSMLSKETSVVFVIMCVAYLGLWDKERVGMFFKIFTPVLLVYLALRVNAVGLLSSAHAAPIGRATLIERLITIPSILLLYAKQFILPVNLSSTYYWVVTTIGLKSFVLPLFLSLISLLIFVKFSKKLQKSTDDSTFKVYGFFLAWFVLSFLMIIQLFPLDMTASETWFYMPMIGLLGMVGVVCSAVAKKPNINIKTFTVVGLLLVIALGARSYVRGYNWKDEMTIAKTDIANSVDNHRANSIVANNYMGSGKFADAMPYAVEALRLYPNFNNYYSLAVIKGSTGKYQEAIDLLEESIPYASTFTAEQSNIVIAQLKLLAHDPKKAEAHIGVINSKYPKNSTILMYLAIAQAANNDLLNAQNTIENAAKYGRIDNQVYQSIMQGRELRIQAFDSSITINPKN